MKNKQRKLIDLVFIISYLVMAAGIAVVIIGDVHYHSSITLLIGLAILFLGVIIFCVIYKIDDEPRCFGGIDA